MNKEYKRENITNNITERRMEKRWFNWDVAGVICAGLTLFLIAFADYVVCIETILPWNSYELTVWSVLNIFFFNCFVALAIVSHYKAVTTDPGSFFFFFFFFFFF